VHKKGSDWNAVDGCSKEKVEAKRDTRGCIHLSAVQGNGLIHVSGQLRTSPTVQLTTMKVINAHFEIMYAPRLVNDLSLAMENTEIDGNGVCIASAAAMVDEAFRPSRVAVELAVEMLLGPDNVASAITLPGMRILPRKPSIWSGRY
jgi:hypothetical protein